MTPSDHAVREQALDSTRSFIVEAPAGSGKTELLTRRYLRLLACVRAPEEIIAITFTRKAAGEMRARVLKALALAEHEMPPTKPMEQAIWPLARAVHEADERFGWQLQSHPARLRIMTIDALNASLAKQLPILSGAGATLAIARDAELLYDDVALRLIERLGVRSEAAEVIARLLRHLDNQYETFQKLLSNELKRREYWLDIGLLRFELPHLRERLEAALRSTVQGQLTAVRSLIPADVRSELVAMATYAAAILNSTGAISDITACDSLSDLPAASAEALPQWQGLAGLLLTEKGKWRATVNIKNGFPPEERAQKKRMLELLQRLQREEQLPEALQLARELPTPEYDDAQWQILTDLLRVLRLAIAELEVVMRERAEADYPANAIAARRALGSVAEPTDLAMRLDYRLQHVLVDEFQDTSRGQVELLALLTAGWSDGDGRTLFCVGDPMQSIYRFRHADVGLFLNLKRHGLNQLRLSPLRLTVNFRSSKPVLDWINRAFVRILPRADDPERGAVPFTSSESKSDAAEAGGVFVHPIVGDRGIARALEAQQIAALISSTHARDPDARIAVLVSSRRHLQSIIRELQVRGIAFQAVEIDALVARSSIQDLIALTRALVHLADRTAWLAVLRAPWCGLSLADLLALCGDESGATIWQCLHDENRVQSISNDGQRRLARVRSILGRALAMRGRIALRDCVERTWHALGGPATLNEESSLRDCQSFFDRLAHIERNGDIEDVARLEHSLRDLYARARVGASTNLELMTIHRAKGLEFEVVILPSLDDGSGRDQSPLLRAQELSHLDDNALLLAPIKARGSDDDPIYSFLGRLDSERARLEKARLLYVAATRAERELHLFGAVEPGSYPRADTFLKLLWPVVEPVFAAQTANDALATSDRRPTYGIETKRLPISWQAPIPNSARTSALKDVVEDQPLHPEFEWVGETGRHVGTLAHREIERLARIGLGDALVTFESQRTRYAAELAELGVPPHLRDAAVGRVMEALKRLVEDDRGRWLFASTHREASSELALTGVIGSQLVNGVIDRTFVDALGTRWIVDFKTSAHEGGGLDEFLTNEAERYRPQLERYAKLMRGHRPDEPIKAALYFPLLKAWREVPI